MTSALPTLTRISAPLPLGNSAEHRHVSILHVIDPQIAADDPPNLYRPLHLRSEKSHHIFTTPIALTPNPRSLTSWTASFMAAASVAASASPPPSAGPHLHHPPYKEMIVRAIESLKEENGSSRSAISKFIAVNYFGLPPKHEALLSTHIHRLKKNGVITTIKHSYVMSGDMSGAPKRQVDAGGSSSPLVVAPKRRGRRPKSDLANVSASLPKRGRLLKPAVSGGRRGRPPKMAILADAAAAAIELPKTGDQAADRKPGRPRMVPPVRLIFPNNLKLGPASMFAARSSKRQKPGRPKKGLGEGSTALLLKKKKPDRKKGLGGVSAALVVDVTDSLGEKMHGRPKRVIQPGAKTVSGYVEGPVGKRKPGRPAKVTNPVSGDVEGSRGRRKPGRPAKFVLPVSGDVEGSRGRMKTGRPAKFALPVSGDVEGSRGKRKPGRPAKFASPLSGDVEGSIGKRKPGRPAKFALPVSGDVEGSVGKRKPGRPAKVAYPVGSVGKRKPGRPAKVAYPVSGDVEGSVGKRKPGRPAKIAYPVSEDVDGSVGKRKPGRPAKVVQLGLSPVTSTGETSTAKRKSRPPQKLLQLGFGSKNEAEETFTRKRKRGRASVGGSNGAAELSSGKKKLMRLQSGLASGAVESSSRKKPGRPKKVVDESVDKKKPSRPQKIMQLGLNSANGAVEASAGKRKQVRPRKIVLPNFNSKDGAMKTSDGNRKPGLLKKTLLPDLNLTNVDVVQPQDADQHAGAVGSVDGNMKTHLTQMRVLDIDTTAGYVAGLSKESVNGEGDASIYNGKFVQLQKNVRSDLNGEVAKGRVVVNGGTTLMNSSQSSIGKRKPGGPKKLSQVDKDTSLTEFGPDPVPAAVNVLLGMRNPGTSAKVSAISSAVVEDGSAAMLNPVQWSSDNAAEGLKLGIGGPVAFTTSMEKKQPGRPDNVMMLNPVMSSPGEVVREVEIVMPTFKRRGRPAKKSR